MKKEIGISILLILLGWMGIAHAVGNAVLVPYPTEVFFIMLTHLGTFSFYKAIIITLLRMLYGMLWAFLIAMILAFSGNYIKPIRELFKPIFAVFKTVPTISYIFLVLLWFGRSKSATIVSFLVLFPIFYMNIVQGLEGISSSYLNLMKIYPAPKRIQIFRIYLPLIENYLYAAFKSAFGLGFKVSVMAEILGQIPNGIGRELQLAKLNFDIPELFAWTIWIILISVLAEGIFDGIRKYWRHSKEK